ncbi:MAG: hypothetical protein A2Y53_04155 [Chloroflexi bacterium RBG_16_47_49]|nr:MAG: hypothetical protein A2Y53_04155 [Chloroflexi bacterium RBG_16_47_49]
MIEKVRGYVCHCGKNIAGTVDVADVSNWAVEQLKHQGVVVAGDYKFMCSSLGQELIEKDIKDLGLTHLVVMSCSPHLHEATFRNTCARTGLNPYLFEMAKSASKAHGSPSKSWKPPRKPLFGSLNWMEVA